MRSLDPLLGCCWLIVGAMFSCKRVPIQGHQYGLKETPVGGV